MIDADLRRFSLKRLMIVITTLSIGLGMATWMDGLMSLMLYGVSIYCVGKLVFGVTDLIDQRPPDQCHWVVYAMNVFGVFVVTISQGIMVFIGLLFLFGLFAKLMS